MDTRNYFSRQPAHMLLVDVNGDLDIDTINQLSGSLEHFFSVICSLSGPIRVPFFGLFALSNYPEALFPLQHVKGNFSRLQTAIEELRTFYKDNASSCQSIRQNTTRTKATQGSITQGVLEAINMFKRQSQGLLQIAGYWSQLEITVMTSSNSLAVMRHVEKALKEVNIDTLKKIGVVCLHNPEKITNLQEDLLPSQNSSHSDASSNSEVTGVVEVTHIDNDFLSLENYFRGWLHDVATDKEHIHIQMLPKGNDKDHSWTLKCDVQERLLNPALTAFANNFSILNEGVGTKPVTGASANKTSNHNIPVYTLKVINIISIDGLCESVLYGMPFLVKATTCWKIDWDELEINQQNFQALCYVLKEKNQCLLAQLEHTMPTAPPKSRQKNSSFRYNISVPQPKGHFVLLPSYSGTLLLKSVAVRELLLPCDYLALQTPDNRVLDELKQVLDQVESMDTFNPLLHESGLGNSFLLQSPSNNLVGSSFKSAQCHPGVTVPQGPSKPIVAALEKRKNPLMNNSVRMTAFGSNGRGQSFTNVQSTSWESSRAHETGNTGAKQPRYKNQPAVFHSGDNSDFPTQL